MANEKRLIDANALKVKGFADPETGEGIVYVQDIDEATTVDAVEVVRCKDCKHVKIDRNGYRWCLVWTGINCMGDDGFCNYGERKDNENP